MTDPFDVDHLLNGWSEAFDGGTRFFFCLLTSLTTGALGCMIETKTVLCALVSGIKIDCAYAIVL